MTRKTATPIDIYFHMTNHYRKLKNVKSVVDTSPPTVFKSQPSRESRLTSRNESRISSANSSDSYYASLVYLKKNRPQSAQPIKSTRRKIAYVPCAEEGSTQHRSASIRLRSASVQVNSPQTSTREQQTTEMSHQKKTSEHEYVRFSLRIMEDIIRNDLHTNRQIQDVFNSHIEANRESLDNERMMQQISLLKNELNIPEKSYTMKESQKCVNCVVAKKNSTLNCDECDVVRNSPLCYRVKELTHSFENVKDLGQKDEDESNTQDDGNITVIGLYDSYKHSMEHTVSEVEKEEINLDQGNNFKAADSCGSTKSEFVLLPGPLYIPKVYLSESKGDESVSVAPVSSEKNHYLLITKNVAVNTDQKSPNCEASTQIETEYKAISTETDQFIDVSNAPQNKIRHVDLNHYDLTPQRDVDISINKADTNLLLGDKYEIVQHKVRNLDVYTLNQFYPTNGTQTSLDRLVPLKKIHKSGQEYFIHNGSNGLHQVKHDRCKSKPKERVKGNLRSGAADETPQHFED